MPTSLPKRSETVCKPTNERKNVRGPCCAETAVRNLPYNAVDLLKQLDIAGFSDWKTLAGHLGNAPAYFNSFLLVSSADNIANSFDPDQA